LDRPAGKNPAGAKPGRVTPKAPLAGRRRIGRRGLSGTGHTRPRSDEGRDWPGRPKNRPATRQAVSHPILRQASTSRADAERLSRKSLSAPALRLPHELAHVLLTKANAGEHLDGRQDTLFSQAVH